MKNAILAVLATSLLTVTAQASRILDCTTLGGKSIQITYGFNGMNTVLEDLKIEGQSAMAQTETFRFTRSGMILTLKGGVTIAESNGRFTQLSSSGENKTIACAVSNTAEKKQPKEF